MTTKYCGCGSTPYRRHHRSGSAAVARSLRTNMMFHLLMLLIIHLIFGTGIAWGQSVNVVVDNLSSSVPSCPNHGCPMFPIDIVNDEEAKDALRILALKDDKQQQQKQALDTLKGSGDESKVVLTLTGFKGGPVPNQDAAVIHSPLKIRTSPESGDVDGKADKKKKKNSNDNKYIPRLHMLRMLICFDRKSRTNKSIRSSFKSKVKKNTDPGWMMYLITISVTIRRNFLTQPGRIKRTI
mmetsp:Transcript_38208/g.92921  ORF Transcript_38208/g.92921 Transcript_38208/m.92921 type:complete len:239 (-) Transcript_38208:269-985(-)